jgi:hypothetical protein
MTGVGATDDNIKRRMGVERWMTMATGTYSKYVALNCFSTAAKVTRMLFNVTLYVHCLSCDAQFSRPIIRILFNDGLSRTDCRASNGRINSEV